MLVAAHDNTESTVKKDGLLRLCAIRFYKHSDCSVEADNLWMGRRIEGDLEVMLHTGAVAYSHCSAFKDLANDWNEINNNMNTFKRWNGSKKRGLKQPRSHSPAWFIRPGSSWIARFGNDINMSGLCLRFKFLIDLTRRCITFLLEDMLPVGASAYKNCSEFNELAEDWEELNKNMSKFKHWNEHNTHVILQPNAYPPAWFFRPGSSWIARHAQYINMSGLWQRLIFLTDVSLSLAVLQEKTLPRSLIPALDPLF